MNLFEIKYSLGFGYIYCAFCNEASARSLYLVNQLLACLGIGKESFYGYFCIFTLNDRSDSKARATKVIQVEVGVVYCTDVYVTVHTAVESEVCILWIYGAICSVINSYNYKVFCF